MARAKLSDEFLAAHRPRLDGIGPWAVNADTNNLDIKWTRPAALQTGWVPLNLKFHTEVDDLPPATGRFDPDERMFALYELFVSRRDEFVTQLRELTAEVDPIERATVEIYRVLGADEDACSCDLQVSFLSDGGEHYCFSRYDPDTDAFGALEG